MLELADIEPYLSERGLISARAVVDGGLRIDDVSRRNRVVVVTPEGERCLVVKADAEADGPGVAREAAVLELLWSADRPDLTAFLPPLVAYDRVSRVLVLETARQARDLTRHHARGRFSRALAAQAGRALAALHAMDADDAAGVPGRVDPAELMRVHRPDLDSLHGMSAAAVELTRVIQGSDELCALLDELLASPRAESMIHGDVRWDNCLALRGAHSGRWGGLRLIDWELAAAGDPAQDVGAFLGEYLRAWLRSIPITDAHQPGRLLSHAGLPLSRMRPALGSFWDAYSSRRGTSAAAAGRTLRRAVRFAAARLLAAALEEAQTLPELSSGVLHLVPLSQNILRRPDDAAAHLLGLGSTAVAAA